MRNPGQFAALSPLGLDEILQQFLGEDTAGSQIVVVCFQSIQGIL